MSGTAPQTSQAEARADKRAGPSRHTAFRVGGGRLPAHPVVKPSCDDVTREASRRRTRPPLPGRLGRRQRDDNKMAPPRSKWNQGCISNDSRLMDLEMSEFRSLPTSREITKPLMEGLDQSRSRHFAATRAMASPGRAAPSRHPGQNPVRNPLETSKNPIN